MKTTKKHIAEQTVSRVIDPPITVKPTLTLDGDFARLWRAYKAAQETTPSDSQTTLGLVRRGLRNWAKERGL